MSIRIDKLSLNYIFRQTFPDMTKKETFHFTLVHKENLVTHLWFGVPFRHQVQWFFNAELPGHPKKLCSTFVYQYSINQLWTCT